LDWQKTTANIVSKANALPCPSQKAPIRLFSILGCHHYGMPSHSARNKLLALLKRYKPLTTEHEIIEFINERKVKELWNSRDELFNILQKDETFKEDYTRRSTVNLICVLGNRLDLLRNPEYLCLSSLQLSRLPKSVWNQKSLKRLDFSQCRNDMIPKEISKLKNLETLNASWNKISSIHENIGKLSNLKDLGLRHNQLTNIHPEFSKLSNLEYLCLDENKISELPDSFENLQNLKKLRLVGNSFTKIPEFIFTLKNLESLSIGWNAISMIPEEISNLKKLHYLGLQGNPLKELPKSFNVLNVSTLNLSHTRSGIEESLSEKLTKALI
jgi:Leucine-rich repeat (LRR) protein